MKTHELWERRDDETPRAWAAFQAYRNLAPKNRSVESAYQDTRSNHGQTTTGNKPSTRIKPPNEWWKWAAVHRWEDRAAAFDRYQDRKRLDAITEAQKAEAKRFQGQLRKDNENFAAGARIALAKALESLRGLSAQTLTAKEAASLLTAATGAIKTANEYQALGLGLNDLMGLLEDDDSKHPEQTGQAREADTES